MTNRRLWALACLLLLAATVVLACVIAIGSFPNGLAVLACVVLAALAAWHAIRRRGAARLIFGAAAVLLVIGALVLVIVEGDLVANLLVIAAFVAAVACARSAFRARMQLPRADPPRRAVLLYNTRSGGGKAERFKLADEARGRGIEPIELTPGHDLEQLVRDAVAGGADGLAMAGGDGSQAIVAMVAAELGLPYACIPAGTRNHFALDLGVDRDDVVGALDAFVDGGERMVDLAEVNGRVFVNNVSLGLYAEAVQREGYREAKLRTLLNTVPDVLGPDVDPPDLSWSGEHGRSRAAAILVSNNGYRLGRAVNNGTRPRMDAGKLGITVIGTDQNDAGRQSGHLGWRQWTAPTFELEAASSVPAGIDGEAVVLESPLRFVSRPLALRVRVAPNHPGASPSAFEPDSAWESIATLARMAFVGETPQIVRTPQIERGE
jgi:diacylglycerol kinase family enzyme